MTRHHTGDGKTGDDAQDAAGSTPLPGFRADNAWEIAAAVVLSLASLVSARSGYQSATTARIEATSRANLADRQVTIDVTTFAAWLSAELASDERPSSGIPARSRPDFVPAFEASHAGTPAGSLPPGSPFDCPEYVLPATVETDRLLRASESEADRADTARQTGENFVLVAVLYAPVLFLAGIATQISSPRSAHAAVALAAVLFVAATAVMLLIPMNIEF